MAPYRFRDLGAELDAAVGEGEAQRSLVAARANPTLPIDLDIADPERAAATGDERRGRGQLGPGRPLRSLEFGFIAHLGHLPRVAPASPWFSPRFAAVLPAFAPVRPAAPRGTKAPRK